MNNMDALIQQSAFCFIGLGNPGHIVTATLPPLCLT